LRALWKITVQSLLPWRKVMSSMEYMVVQGVDNMFVQRVNKHISNGWEPLGGVNHEILSHKPKISVFYTQAMVRKVLTDE